MAIALEGELAIFIQLDISEDEGLVCGSGDELGGLEIGGLERQAVNSGTVVIERLDQSARIN